MTVCMHTLVLTRIHTCACARAHTDTHSYTVAVCTINCQPFCVGGHILKPSETYAGVFS